MHSAGAGFFEPPVATNLMAGNLPSKSYKQGFYGGKGINLQGKVTEGGFGGGGALTERWVKAGVGKGTVIANTVFDTAISWYGNTVPMPTPV